MSAAEALKAARAAGISVRIDGNNLLLEATRRDAIRTVHVVVSPDNWTRFCIGRLVTMQGSLAGGMLLFVIGNYGRHMMRFLSLFNAYTAVFGRVRRSS
jgi:hypothetical protein